MTTPHKQAFRTPPVSSTSASALHRLRTILGAGRRNLITNRSVRCAGSVGPVDAVVVGSESGARLAGGVVVGSEGTSGGEGSSFWWIQNVNH